MQTINQKKRIREILARRVKFEGENADSAMMRVYQVCHADCQQFPSNPPMARRLHHLTDTLPDEGGSVAFYGDSDDRQRISAHITPAWLMEQYLLPNGQYVSALLHPAKGFLDPPFNPIGFENLYLHKPQDGPHVAKSFLVLTCLHWLRAAPLGERPRDNLLLHVASSLAP